MKQLRNVAPCLDCGGIVAPSAVSCPHCGSTEFRTLITDPIVEQAVREELGMPEGELTNAHLKKVTELYLAPTQITDAGLKEMAKLHNLNELDLFRTQITDAGLKEVAKLQNLKGLYLADTQITHEGLKEVAKLQKLEVLYLEDYKITKEDVAELKKALPNCKITGP